MFCSMLACGQNGEIGLNGELPWEGQYPEDREFYEGQTELALRIGTRGAIAHFSPNRPCCLISANVQKPRDCIYVYNWKELSVEQIFSILAFWRIQTVSRFNDSIPITYCENCVLSQ